ncbi:MAG TPA: hypothetical protein VFY48_00695 [Solirubrobacterales bacterium]|nr:hypothetical protein [Solirubrobacterales bacterium]
MRGGGTSDRGRAGGGRAALAVAAAILAFLLLPAPQSEAAPCASGDIDGSFASSPTSGAISSDDEVDCFSLSNLSAGDQVSVDFEVSAVVNGFPSWRVLDGNGDQVCSYWGSTTCVISGGPGWSLEIYDASASVSTFSYGLAVRRLTDPSGCASLGGPDTWSFTLPRTDGSVASSLDARCYTFTRAVGEADGSYWLRAVRTAGTLSPHWSVYGPSGSMECQGFAGGLENACQLLAFGQFTVVVEPYGGSQAGSFFLTTRRLNAASGCTSSPPLAIGAAPAPGSISSAGEADCHTLAGLSAGDAISVGLTAPTGSNHTPRLTVIDSTGNRICEGHTGSSFDPCTLTGTPGWSVVVYDQGGAATFSYSLAVRRLTDPQGCTPLGDPEVWSFASARLNGSIAGTLDARCYTFDREPGEEDGVYWFRAQRSAGTLAPYWAVYGPSGSRECSSAEVGFNNNCELLASGQYTFLVADNAGEKTGSFIATARRLTDPEGCSTLPSIAFGAAPVAGDLATGGSIDCYSLPEVAVGNTVSIDFLPSPGASPRWLVIDANGNPFCSSDSYYEGAPCPLQGTAGWSLLVYDTGTSSFSYSLAVRRLTNPQGCSSLGDPAVWSFTAPRINDTIEAPLATRCYTFDRAISDPDGVYWFRTLRTSGALNPAWSVYGASGQRECAGSNGSPEDECRLYAAGRFALVVRDSGWSQSGTFLATAKRLTSPEGCSELSSIAFGIAPVSGNLSAGGEVDCYRLDGSAQDVLSFSGTGSADSFALLDSEGTVRCRWFNYPCTIVEDGELTLLVYSGGGTATGKYRFEAECENVPCGQSNTAVTDVSPNRVGPGKFTTIVLRGRDLELLESAKLVRNGVSVAGELKPAASDGRAVEARFDLEGAAPGSWELEAAFIDGTTRNLPGAVFVETLRPARISVELIGREAFRAGRPSTVTLSVHNSGNVDGMIVPVTLSGVPEGSIVEPLFQMRTPAGSHTSPDLEAEPFDQETDALVLEDGIAVPMYLPSVPPQQTEQYEFRVTAPAAGTSYTLRAVAGQCLGTLGGGGATTSAIVPKDVLDALGCAQTLAQQVIGFLPGGDCINTALDAESIIEQAIFYPLLGIEDDPVGVVDSTAFAVDAVGCGTELTVVPGAVKKLAKWAGWVTGAVQFNDDCLKPQSEAELPQQRVGAIDPNEIVGPAGIGVQRFVTGDEPFDYQVLFENLPAATAPAQRVEVRNQLDVTHFDPESVLFHDVRFGSTVYSLPYSAHEIDDTIDLRPDRDLLVDVDADVSAGGLIEVTLQALDPETLEPPSDPLAGFLPPNVAAPEGEGLFSYTVTPKTLSSGTVVANQASIVFDENEPIETPTWTNTIDREPPAATVTVEGEPAPDAAKISWSGSDDAAGIALYEVRVSKNGGPFSLWKASSAPGSATFVAAGSGNYSFRVVARDGADNVGQSPLAGIALAHARSLTVVKSGLGTVTSNPTGIQCGSTCEKAFASGTEVTLTATPSPGYVFTGWPGTGCGGTGACTVSMETDVTVTARFEPVSVQRPDATGPAPPEPPATRGSGATSCAAAAVKAFRKASKAARKKTGKARSRALKAATQQKQRRLARCRAGA